MGPGSGMAGRGTSIGVMGETGAAGGSMTIVGWKMEGVAGSATAPERDHGIPGPVMGVGVHWASRAAGSGAAGTRGGGGLATTGAAGRTTPPESTHSWGSPLQAETTRTTSRRGRGSVPAPVGRRKSISPAPGGPIPPETEAASTGVTTTGVDSWTEGAVLRRGPNRYGAKLGPLAPASRLELAARSRIPSDRSGSFRVPEGDLGRSSPGSSSAGLEGATGPKADTGDRAVFASPFGRSRDAVDQTRMPPIAWGRYPPATGTALGWERAS